MYHIMSELEKWGNIRVLNTLISDIKNAIEESGKFSSVSDFANHALEKQLNQGDSHFKNILSKIKHGTHTWGGGTQIIPINQTLHFCH